MPIWLLAAAAFAYAEGGKTDLRDGADTVWTIESGTYAGQQVPLELSRAIGRKGQKDRFWRFAGGRSVSEGIVGWKSTKYPIPVAFRRNRHSAEISASDSIGFWSILSNMNADFGIEVFRPATLNADDPIDFIVVDLGIMREADGLSRVTWAPSGELFDVRVTLRDAGVLHNSHVVTHEMMHALGFGHTSSWKSVVNPDGRGTERLTPEDVAYAELAMHSRVDRERIDTRLLIALAVAREPKRIENDEYAPCGIDPGVPVERLRDQLPAGTLTVVPECEER